RERERDSVIPTDKVEVGFKDLDAAILVGSMPRKEGMERKDLLKANVAIFKTQGCLLYTSLTMDLCFSSVQFTCFTS
uniref:Malate dehydrogenase, cytoplasmic n=1 Tax=Seriola lalandi dorsalis TaxID=1841481 RepID=A0A3B4XT71_SERLL